MTPQEAVRRIERVAEEKLRELDLSGLELEEVPPEIANYTQLETLLLARSDEKKTNKLTKFPDAVLQLTNLKTLNRASQSDYPTPRSDWAIVQSDTAYPVRHSDYPTPRSDRATVQSGRA